MYLRYSFYKNFDYSRYIISWSSSFTHIVYIYFRCWVPLLWHPGIFPV